MRDAELPTHLPVAVARRIAPAHLGQLVADGLDAFLGLLLLAQATVVFWGAFSGCVLNSRAFWAEELARLTLVWLAFIGVGVAAWKGAPFRVDFLYRRLRPGLKASVDGFNVGLVGGYALALFRPTPDLAATRQPVGSPWLGVSEAVLYIGLILLGFGQAARFLCLPTLGKRTALATGILLVSLVTVFKPQGALFLGHFNPFLGPMGLLCLLPALQLPIAFALGLNGSLYLFDLEIMPAPVVPQRMVAGVNSFVLLAVPLFIFAGAIMDAGAISRRIADFARALVGWLKGGLTTVSVVAQYLFSGISGSTADVAAIGSVLIPPCGRQVTSGRKQPRRPWEYSCRLLSTWWFFQPWWRFRWRPAS